MSIRRFRSMALAGVAVSALMAGQVLVAGQAHAQDCETELQQVRAELGETPVAPAARGDIRRLLSAAESLHQAGDEEGCLTVVAHIRNVAHTGMAGAPGAQADMTMEEIEAERRERVEMAEPLQGIVRLDILRDMQVVDRGGEDLGSITDVVVDLGERRVRYALLSRGSGWFGLGQGEIYPIPLEAFHIAYDVDTGWMAEAEGAFETEEEAEVAEQPAEQPEAEVAEEQDPRVDHPLYSMTAGEIEGMNVINAQGDNIGSVSEVYFSYAEEDVFVLVPVGGFLGFGTHDVGLPLADLQLGDGELLLPAAVTTDHLQELPEADYSDEQVIPSDMVIADALYGMAERTPESESRRMLEGDAETAEATEAEQLEQQEQQAQQQEQQPEATEVAAAEEPREEGEEVAAEEELQEQEQRAEGEARERHDFDNSVLVLRIDAEALDGAPSFSSDDWPNFDDPDWHDRVVVFYGDLLGTNDEQRASD